MALVTTKSVDVFDTRLVNKGDLIYVQHVQWNDPKRGIVIYASEEKLVILYHPNIANVTNRQEILAKEVAEGKYKIRWSSDLLTVSEYVSEGGGQDDVR